MPRVPYQPQDIAEPKELVEAIRARRGGNLLNLDRMLLHSPPLAKGWNVFLREIRNNLALPPKLRELAICVVAILNGAEYEFHHHAPEFLKAGGTPAQVDALRNPTTAAENADLFNDAERAAIQFTVELTRQAQVSAPAFARTKSLLADERHVIELTAVVATYNMVSRFLIALEIEPER